ncbi:MAG: PAS domain-containing protein, partial [Oscillospiraceae bacterium]
QAAEQLRLEQDKASAQSATILQLYDSMPCGVLLYTLEDAPTLRFCNQRTTQLLALSDDGLPAGRGALPLIPYLDPCDRAGFLVLHQRLRQEGEKQELSCHLLGGDGRSHLLVGTVSALTSPGGERLAHLVFVDATAFRDMEQKSDLQEQAIRIAVEQTGIIFWIYDIAARCIVRDDNFSPTDDRSPLLSHVPDCLFGTGLVHPEDEPQVSAMFDALLSGERLCSCVARFRSIAAGGYRWCKIFYTTLYDEEGKPTHAVGSSLDVEEQMGLQTRFYEFEACQQVMARESQAAFLLNVTRGTVTEISGNGTSAFSYLLHGESMADFFNASVQNIQDPAQIKAYHAIYDRDALLASFAGGITHLSLDCRYTLPDRDPY